MSDDKCLQLTTLKSKVTKLFKRKPNLDIRTIPKKRGLAKLTLGAVTAFLAGVDLACSVGSTLGSRRRTDLDGEDIDSALTQIHENNKRWNRIKSEIKICSFLQIN